MVLVHIMCLRTCQIRFNNKIVSIKLNLSMSPLDNNDDDVIIDDNNSIIINNCDANDEHAKEN